MHHNFALSLWMSHIHCNQSKVQCFPQATVVFSGFASVGSCLPLLALGYDCWRLPTVSQHNFLEWQMMLFHLHLVHSNPQSSGDSDHNCSGSLNFSMGFIYKPQLTYQAVCTQTCSGCWVQQSICHNIITLIIASDLRALIARVTAHLWHRSCQHSVCVRWGRSVSIAT